MGLKHVLEDDVIEVFGDALELNNYLLLCIGGKQAGSFKYSLPNGKRKAPDIVAVNLDSLDIIITEAKIRASAIFRSDDRGVSDYNSLVYLLNTPTAYKQLLDQVNSKMKCLGYNFEEPRYTIRCVLLAGNSLEKYAETIESSDVMGVTADVMSKKITIYNDRIGVFSYIK